MNINKKQIKDLQELNAGFDYNDTFVLAQSGSGNFPARKIRLSNIGSGGSGGSGLPCEIVSTLTETTPGKALDATMGKVLNDTKLDRSNPSYTGHMASNGSMSIDGKIWSEEEVGSQNILAESYLTLGPDAIIRYISGFSGGSPIYSTIEPEDIMVKNGTNYLMVYGTGTPAENGAELLAAYEEAKKMPRYLGDVFIGPDLTLYKGQTFRVVNDGNKYMVALRDFTGNIYNLQEKWVIPEVDAKSVRTTLIVAPGEYNFGASAFTVDTDGINIVSLTGNSDVIINSTEENSIFNYTYGIKITANYTLIKGINCKTNTFYIADNLDNLICEYCIGGYNSFSGHGTASGTFNYCIGGTASFGSTASGTFNNCIGGDGSFGGTASGIFNDCIGGGGSFGGYGGTASGTFNHCTGDSGSFGGYGGTASGIFNNCITSGTFSTPTGEGKIYNCIDGNGTLVNYPALVADVTIPTNANLPGSPTTTTQPATDNSSRIATTAFANASSSVAVITDNRGGITYSEFYAKEFLYVVSNQNTFELNVSETAPVGTKIIFKALPGATFTIPLSTPGGGTVDGQDTDTATYGNNYTLTSAELIKGVTLIHRGGNDWITLK